MKRTGRKMMKEKEMENAIARNCSSFLLCYKINFEKKNYEKNVILPLVISDN
jgi:hypothetical protein